MSFFGSYSSTTTTYAYNPCFFEYPQSKDSISNDFTSKFCFERPWWELEKCEKKHGKIDICYAVIFRLFCLMAWFVPIIRVYFRLLIITAIRYHFFTPELEFGGSASTLKVIVKNNFENFKMFIK